MKGRIFTRIIFLNQNEPKNENRRYNPGTISFCRNAKHKDIIVCAISSVAQAKLTENEMLITPQNTNKLRVSSVLKVDRIVTLKRKDVIHQLGKLSVSELEKFKNIFRRLVQ